MIIKQDHSSLVKELIDYFHQEGLEVAYANYQGYTRPFTIKRHRPDILAIDRKNELGYIGTAKLCGEITDQTSREQFEDYPKRIMKNGKSKGLKMPFYIAVPQECQTKVKDTFTLFQIPWKENIRVLGF